MISVHAQLRDEVLRKGGIPFIRFMERALYCPEGGYYEQIRHTPGKSGDYFTSVSVGHVFGGLLARQICRWLDCLAADRVELVEGGAHDGRLARDILVWMGRHRPDCADRVRYVILEPSPQRRAWQLATLGETAGQVDWVEDWGGLTERGIRGVVLANELLDAMPVVRLGWDAAGRHWFEWGVVCKADRFAWARLPRATVLPVMAEQWLQALTAGAGERLQEGVVVEIAPGALVWWGQAAQALREGVLMALDYGWDEGEGWRLASAGGTLRAYRGHDLAESVLDCPGEQDLTAHVNWGLIRSTGEAAGLDTVELTPQGRWLSRLAAEGVAQSGPEARWALPEVRQFHMLTHPAYLGTRFQVLVQKRDLRARHLGSLANG